MSLSLSSPQPYINPSSNQTVELKKSKYTIRVLYLNPGPVPPERDPSRNKFFYLSKYFSGDIISPIWGSRTSQSIKAVQKINHALGNFRLHFTLSLKLPKEIRYFWDLCFYLYKGISLHFTDKHYHVIVTYGIIKTGMAGAILKYITGAKLVIEVPGNPKKTFLLDSEVSGGMPRIKNWVSNFVTPFILNRADCIRLLYPSQLIDFPTLRDKASMVFHDFVPVSTIECKEGTGNYILFMGHPWYLKGIDILIKAFNILSDDFPEYHLKIVGYCPDKSHFQKLADGNGRIQLCDPVFYSEAMELMSACRFFVLPSRTEAMGRVLLEAMACRKAVIASNVDGIPYYVQHNFNGLLVEPGDVASLVDALKSLMGNPFLLARLAENGYQYVHQHLSEAVYVDHFRQMVYEVTQ